MLRALLAFERRHLSIAGAVGFATVAYPLTASADGFAEPPGEGRFAIAVGSPRPSFSELLEPQPELSPVRVLVGPAGKLDAASASPGFLVALDIGRGPAGARF